MAENTVVESGGAPFTQLLEAVVRLPGVRIDRTAYLRAALRPYCPENQVERAVATTPATAGVPKAVLDKVAAAAIRLETTKVTGLSAAAGVPGGFALVGTVPADMAQYLGHILRLTQKLAYVYSWPDLFDGEDLDDDTMNILTLFIGVAFGVSTAQTGVSSVSKMLAAQTVKKLPQKALTKGTIYPIVKKVASRLGATMTKQIFAGGLAKAIPLIGAGVSGGFTYVSFRPMAGRLRRHLAGLELAAPAVPAVPAASVLD